MGGGFPLLLGCSAAGGPPGWWELGGRCSGAPGLAWVCAVPGLPNFACLLWLVAMGVPKPVWERGAP